MRRSPQPEEQGVILLNVLVIVAIASAVVVLMVTGQDLATERSVRFSDASQALSIVHGGELSAVTALRRDAVTSPRRDDLTEPWAAVGQREVAIAGGRFSLSIVDAQARFNLNSLVLGGVTAEGAVRDLCVVARGRQVDCDRLISYVRLTGPLEDLDDLAAAADLDPAFVARLDPLVTALPEQTTVNVNTADEVLLATLMRNPAAANFIATRRAGRGFVDEETLRTAGAIASPALAETSRFFWVETTVTIGETPQRMRALVRRSMVDGAPRVAVVARKKIPAAPLSGPPA